jgi:predicted dehydrogenase
MKRSGARGKGSAAKVRFAVIGQGHFAQTTILPAFANARRAQLAAIFSDEASKLAALRRRYGVEHALPCGELDEFLRSGAVEAIYIALPNDLHAEFTERAAAAGVHVLCEKPMASSSAHAQRMMAACARARVKLMIAYRLHFDQANMAAVEILKSGKIGDPRYLSAIFSQQVTRAGDSRFREIDEQVSALLKFPGDRLAQITCSFGAADVAACTVLGTKGRLRLDPAFDLSDLSLEVEIGGKTRRKTWKAHDQIAPELDELAACIREGRDPEPSGREGLADLRVIEAIEASARSGTRVAVARVFPETRPSMRVARRARATRESPGVHVQPPSQ